MRAEGFTEDESQNCAIQMRIRRRLANDSNYYKCNNSKWVVEQQQQQSHHLTEHEHSHSHHVVAEQQQQQLQSAQRRDYNTNETAALNPNDPRVQQTIKLLQRTHKAPGGLSVPKAMRAEGFRFEDCNDVAKQMWIRRRLGVRSIVDAEHIYQF